VKGVRFYDEYINTTKRQPTGNVVAVFVENGVFWSNGQACYEALAGIYAHGDSPVASTGVSLDYLSKNCKRISEQKARKIHHRLFERLDD
jgi:hypothetical protein